MFQRPHPWENKNRILITAHAFVDPDALGSILAMGAFLKSLDKEVTMLACGGVPRNLRFLLEDREVLSQLPQPLSYYDQIIVVDCGDIELPQIADLADHKNKIVNIDHHADNGKYGTVNWVDSSFSAASEIIYEILKEANFEITGHVATALLAGIMSDTGSFRHANTNARVLKSTGELLLKGARLASVVKHLFAGKTAGQLKAWSYVLEKANMDKQSGAIVSVLTQEDLEKLNVDESAFEGIVEILNTFPQARFAALARQRGDEVKFSLRSEEYKGVNVSELARRFGGGGHKLAAGFTIRGKLKRENGNINLEPN